MAQRETDVLVEVERVHLCPRHVGAGHERLDERELRRTGRHDDACAPAGLHGLDDGLRHFAGRGGTERGRIGMNRDSHCARL